MAERKAPGPVSIDLQTLRELDADDGLDQLSGTLWHAGTFEFADDWRERAAILEADGMRREQAEAEAYEMVKSKGAA